MSLGSVSLTKQDVLDGQSNFSDHYALAGGANVNPTILTVPLVEFMDVIKEAITVDSIPHDRLALKIIHRYDATGWFLTMVCCQLDRPVSSADKWSMYIIKKEAKRYDIKNNTIVRSAFIGNFDISYFNTVMYRASPADPLSNLIPDTHVKNMLVPWKYEILRMYSDNKLYLSDVTKIKLAMTVCSYDTTIKPAYSKVLWHHGVVFYFIDNGTELLDNTPHASLFENRAADFSTLCPPHCDTFIYPEELDRNWAL